MKAGPVIAMVALIFLGMWLVLQPALTREAYDYEVRIGSKDLRINRTPGGYVFVSPPSLARLGELSVEERDRVIEEQVDAWKARPAFERTLMGFFNITEWINFSWVAIGLIGQGAFFGRMFVQWVVSEKSRQSQVPEIFWWFSLVGGIFLFVYFVWRVDVVGVLGQSTGIVIYARNLRLIHKQKQRTGRQLEEDTHDGEAPDERPA